MSAEEARSSASFEEDLLFDLPPGTDHVNATSDGRHVFWFARINGKIQYSWDGRPGEPFDDLLPTPEGALYHWSPQSDRVAYWGQRSGSFFVGIDGLESATYVGVTRSVPPTFSADGRRLAYGVLTHPQTAYLVVDGELRRDQNIAPVRAVFSPHGTRLAYVGTRPEKAQWIVIDDVRGPEFDGIGAAAGDVAFSPDERHFAYIGIRGAKSRMVLDGQEHQEFDAVGSPTFSADSKRFAYVAREARRMWLVVDGHAGLSHDAVLARPLFSPDSRRLAYAVAGGKTSHMVVDGVPGPEFADLYDGWTFSPDSKHFAYGAVRQGSGLLGGRRRTWHMVRDGTPGGAEFEEFASRPRFSPDGAHVAYTARRANDWFVVVDQDTQGPYRGATPPRFSDSGRLAYVAAMGDRDWRVVVDGRLGPRVESVTSFGDGFVSFSPDGSHFAAVVGDGAEERPMVDHELGPRYTGVFQPVVHGQHIVFLAVRGSSCYRVSRPLVQ